MHSKWIMQIFRRRVLLALFLILQFVIFAVVINQSIVHSVFLETFFFFLSVGVALHVVWKKGKEAYKISWILQVLIFPVYGTLFYLMFNRQTVTKKVQQKLENVYNLHKKFLLNKEEDFSKAKEIFPEYAPQMHYLEQTMNYPVYGNTEVAYYSIGETYHKAMLEELKKAEKYIFFEFFIVGEGKMWESMLQIMEEKAAQGVKVRVMYDDFGCFVTLPNNTPKMLEEKGIECRVYNPFHPVITSAQNNRDHRKVLSIDGKIAFTGGINIADEYINEIDRFGHWKDTGIKLDGPGAWGLTLIFLQLWQTMDEEWKDASIEGFLPEFSKEESDSSRGYVQPYADSPTDSENVGEHVFIKMIHAAKEFVHIFTPYLILDEHLITSLVLAAQSGIDVKIVTPQNPDKYLVHVTTRSYYQELIEAGVKIYEYTNGFMHGKQVIVDNKTAVIGTINFDYRSLYLHFENNVALYGTPAIQDMTEDFKATVARSTEITSEDMNRTFVVRLTKSILRLFAPLM